MKTIERMASIWKLLCTDTELSRYVTESDISHFEARCEAEGLPFLTTTLPQLGKALDQSFRTGQYSIPKGFKRDDRGAYPKFLSGAFRTLFQEDGQLLPGTRPSCDLHYECLNYDAGAVACIRQLTLMFYKLELPYSDALVDQVYERFILNEIDLGLLEQRWPADRVSPIGTKLDHVLTRARHVVHRLLAGVDPTNIRPRHGSGASACRTKPWQRYDDVRFIPDLHRVYPYDQYFYSGMTHFCDELSEFIAKDEYVPQARVVLVPKDSRGPRLISCEPRETMFIQQGQMTLLYNTVERYPAIRNQIGFTDQGRNQVYARNASIDQRHATIDMKDASDRVSVMLVRSLFPRNWYEALMASRSGSTLLPCGTEVPLRKFAPMGSAVCFPVEAICFWALALAAAYSSNATIIGEWSGYINRLFTDRLRPHERERVSVFGDDIIIESQHVNAVMEVLEAVGLSVNRDKSFWEGPFRESCGHDYFKGRLVTPIRCNHLLDDNKSARFHACSLANNLMNKFGVDIIGPRLHQLIESWYGPLPVFPEEHSLSDSDVYADMRLGTVYAVLGRSQRVPRTIKRRYNLRYHRKEYYLQMMVPRKLRVQNDSWGFVLYSLLGNTKSEPSTDWALAKRPRFKYGWAHR